MEPTPNTKVRTPEPESDLDRFRRLLQASHPAILVQTLEESYASEFIRKATLDQRLHLKAWKMSRGVYDADFADGSAVAETEHPAAALQHLVDAELDRVLVLLFDVVEHLTEARTVRLLRDLIDKLRK